MFAALIAPWFIDWNNYKANFEAEAEKILGQPVRVNGTADARILPSPSLTFTDVAVGDNEGNPMMTVDRFEVTIELMPLLQGRINVTSMRLDHPVMHISVDDAGQVDWLLRTEASKTLDPDNVALNDVEIVNGELTYTDSHAGLTFAPSEIQARVQADSLSGPWHVEGSYAVDGSPVEFGIATGRFLDDGSIRVKTDVTPANVPFVLAADGVIAERDDGLSYEGTYKLTQIIAAATKGETGEETGWRSEGTFNLTRDRVIVDRAILSEGPPDRPSSLAGSLILYLGKFAKFEAVAEARQIDLDRSLGKGPKEPVDVGIAAQRFVDWLSTVPVPAVPGTVRVNVPGIVVGGAVIQDVGFEAASEDGGWQIRGLHARLPGQATLEADGTLSTGDKIGFGGLVRLVVGQPATFASWWRGHSDQGLGRLLAPFDLAGRATISLGAVTVEDMTTKIGDATITGAFSWTGATEGAPLRLLRTDLKADRVDFLQVRALAELLVGKDLADTTALADSYAIKLGAGELKIEDIVMRDVTVDASLDEGALTVGEIDVGDLGGAHLAVTRGQIDNVLTAPKGHLEAQLSAADLTGVGRIVDRLFPDTAFSRWLARSAPSLAPASLALTVDSTAAEAGAVSHLTIKGSAAATNFDAAIELAGPPAAWRRGQAKVTASLSSYDALAVAAQAGLAAAGVELGGGVRLNLTAEGTPETGMQTVLDGSFGGLTVSTSGTLVLAADAAPAFDGEFRMESDDVVPLLKLTGLTLPGTVDGIAVGFAGKLATKGLSADIAFPTGTIAGHRVGAKLHVAAAPAGGPEATGTVDLDTLDLGWVAALGLGFAPMPTDDPQSPWSKTPFSEPAFHSVSAKLDLTAERLSVGSHFEITSPKMSFGLAPDRLDFDVASGGVIGGSIAGGLSIHNVGGNASVTGRLSLVGGSLDSLVWERGGRAVATGTVDLSANFESTGRSPAGLVSSLTGGGTLAIHNGEARYINPQAVSLVIRAVDLGQEFADEALAAAFAGYIDGGSLRFGEAEGPFAIAAGTLRFQNFRVATNDARVSGNAAIDLNTLTLESDWNLTLDPGDVKSETPPPEIGLIFNGPLAAPSRSIDVLQFASYLNIRKEERIQEILALEEEARLEKEKFNREKRKLREDQARRERDAEAARAARAAATARLEAFHVVREERAEERAATELAAATAIAEKALAERRAVEKAVSESAAAAAKARADADRALTDAKAKEEAAEAAEAFVTKAAAEREAAEAAVGETETKAGDAAAAVPVAAEATAAAVAALSAADQALASATAAREEATGAAKAGEEAVAGAQAQLATLQQAVDAGAAALSAAKTEADKSAAAASAATAAAEAAAKAADDAEAASVAEEALAQAAGENAAKLASEVASTRKAAKQARTLATRAVGRKDAAAARVRDLRPKAEEAARLAAAAEATALREEKQAADDAARLVEVTALLDAERERAAKTGPGIPFDGAALAAAGTAVETAAAAAAASSAVAKAAAEALAGRKPAAEAAAAALAEAEGKLAEETAAADKAAADAAKAEADAAAIDTAAEAARVAADRAADSLAAAKKVFAERRAAAASARKTADALVADADAASARLAEATATASAAEARAAEAAATLSTAEADLKVAETALAERTEVEASAAAAAANAAAAKAKAEEDERLANDAASAAQSARQAAVDRVAAATVAESDAQAASEAAAAAATAAAKAALDADRAAAAAEAKAEEAAAALAAMPPVYVPASLLGKDASAKDTPEEGVSPEVTASQPAPEEPPPPLVEVPADAATLAPIDAPPPLEPPLPRARPDLPSASGPAKVEEPLQLAPAP